MSFSSLEFALAKLVSGAFPRECSLWTMVIIPPLITVCNTFVKHNLRHFLWILSKLWTKNFHTSHNFTHAKQCSIGFNIVLNSERFSGLCMTLLLLAWFGKYNDYVRIIFPHFSASAPAAFQKKLCVSHPSRPGAAPYLGGHLWIFRFKTMAAFT